MTDKPSRHTLENPRSLPSKSQVLVVGLARNCGLTIASEVATIGAALRGFRSVRWLVIESDSDDNTVEALSIMATHDPGFRYLSLGALRKGLPLRTERIAHCRNRYLQEIRSHADYHDVDFVVVADLDGMNGQLTSEGIASCFERDDWDACTANQSAPYYDVWALRHDLWSSGDCWEQQRFLAGLGMEPEEARYRAVYCKMIRLPMTSPWIEVRSAFGGLAIYTRRAMLSGGYAGVGADGRETCEHVAFNEGLTRQGMRIFINPKLINGSHSAHTEPVRARNLARLEVGRALRAIKRWMRRDH